MILNMSRGGGVSQIVCVVIAGFSICSPHAMAQNTITYTYTGQPYNTCPQFVHCPAGHVTGSVTFVNIPLGYTGTATDAQIKSYSLTGTGVGATITYPTSG